MKDKFYEGFSTSESTIIDKWLTKIKRGYLRIIILRKFMEFDIDNRPIALSGAKIQDYIKTRSENRWTPSPGSIYPIFAEMEKEGIIQKITSENKKNKEFIITEFGRKLYQQLIYHSMIFSSSQSIEQGSFQQEFLERQFQSIPIKTLKERYERYKKIMNTAGKILQQRILEEDL